MAVVSTYSDKKLEPGMPFQDDTISVAFAPSQNIARGTVLGIITASGLYKAYASGSADGSQIPKALCIYDIQVDASGNVTYSGTAGQVGNEFGIQQANAPVRIRGTALIADLVGLDATALTNQPAWILQGTLSGGGYLQL